MPMNCCVNERYNSRGKTALPFHQMKRLQNAWNQRVSRKNFESSNYFYVCSDHFSDIDTSKPNPDTPLEYQRKRVWKGDYSQRKFCDKVPKRKSMTSVKARTGGTDILCGHWFRHGFVDEICSICNKNF